MKNVCEECFFHETQENGDIFCIFFQEISNRFTPCMYYKPEHPEGETTQEGADE